MTRKEAKEYIIKHCNPHRDTSTQWDDAMECAIKALGEPERKKGEWILSDNQRREDTENGNYLYFCSNCLHSDIHSKRVDVPYCWHCGADMRGEDDDTN